MLSEILSLEGVTPLSKNQQGKISGGEQICRIRRSTLGVNFVDEMFFADGAAGSREANAFCVDLIVSGDANRCSYDCSYDGNDGLFDN